MKKLIATVALLSFASFGTACDYNMVMQQAALSGPGDQNCEPPPDPQEPHPLLSCDRPAWEDEI
jgi:hypothetical protein